MTRPVFAIFLAAVFAATVSAYAQSTTLQGSWFITPSGTPDRVQFELRMDDSPDSHGDVSSHTMTLGDLGLTQAQLNRTGSPLDFTFRRQAGDIVCKGSASEGTGFGHFVFTANPQYIEELRRRGYTVDEPHKLLAATMLDISTSYIDSVAAAGFPNLDYGKLIAFRALGIDAPYIQAARKQFGNIDSGNIITLRALHVDSAYVDEMAAVGYTHLSTDDLIQMRALGIDAAFVRRAEAHGFKDLSVHKLIEAKALGVF